MSWVQFSRGLLFAKIYVFERDGEPKFLTPLYVPSFSSFGDRDFGTRALATLETLRSLPNHMAKLPVLLSAYDLRRRLGIGQESVPKGLAADLISELGNQWNWYLDSGVFEHECFYGDAWSADEFVSVFRATAPPSVVSFDFKPTSASVADFEKALAKTTGIGKILCDSSTTLLIRFHDDGGLWERDKTFSEQIRIDSLLTQFTSTVKGVDYPVDVIGVVENELGPGIRSRVRSIARLRLALEKADLGKPVHVFGVSDPQSIAFYSLAGGDIFDGVSWSRYYLDTDDYCVRDKSLLSWKEPAIGESASISQQNELLGVENIVRMQRFMSSVRRLIETRQPKSVREEAALSFVHQCCEDILQKGG